MATDSAKVEIEESFPGGMDAVKSIIGLIGDNPEREGLLDTPYRVAKSWSELFAGYRQSPSHILSTVFEDGMHEMTDEIVICKNIPFTSMCEHHMLPFSGIAHIGYLPNNKVVGISKLARLVDCFARRLQIQEKMTCDIANAIETHLEPQGVAVIIEAQHLCMQCRGVKKTGTSMVTSAMRGKFKTQAVTRSEFLTLIK